LTGPIAPIVRPLCDGLVGRSAKANHKRLVDEAFRRAERRGMVNAIQSISLRRQDLTPDLAAVTAPTLFVAGADDPMWTPDEASAATSLLRHGGCEIVPGGGHVAPLYEAPDAIAGLVESFWRDTAGTRHMGQLPAVSAPTRGPITT
jgi:pimeloyl-ACP methyl ester carboxylesterase